MKIIIGSNSGFCTGVSYTVKKAYEIVKKNPKVYSMGELVHNERVISDLEKEGMITVDSISRIPPFSTVIFRAHGEGIGSYQIAKEKNLDIVDLTCGKIKIIRKKINKKKKDHFILIIGKKNHPETIGTISFSGDYSYIAEDEMDVLQAIREIKNSPFHKIYVVSQTTFSSPCFDNLISYLKDNISYEIIVDKTICDATEKRQKEVKELSLKVDKMIIVGGKNSSNTKELYELAKKNLKDVFFVQDASNLDLSSFTNKDTIGIMAGASTPDVVVQEIIEKLNHKI